MRRHKHNHPPYRIQQWVWIPFSFVARCASSFAQPVSRVGISWRNCAPLVVESRGRGFRCALGGLLLCTFGSWSIVQRLSLWRER